jgi:hypothetical protein
MSYCVILDANVWVAERLLQSSIGSAFLYALSVADAIIGVPEVVEIETSHVLEIMCEDAIEDIRQARRLLQQMSEHRALYTGPSSGAIREGIASRWKALSGRIERVPFSLEQAGAALQRVVQGVAPAAKNNEQFRDCCIWEAAKLLASNRPVHLVSNDAAFFEGRDRKRGLAESLREEAATNRIDIDVYPTIATFLTAKAAVSAALDEKAIAAAIVKAVEPLVYAKAAGDDARSVSLTLLGTPTIHGYSTPKPSALAISFEVSYDCKRINEDKEVNSRLSIRGTCSYDARKNSISEIEVKEWHDTLPIGEGFTTLHFSGHGTWWRPRRTRFIM